MNLFLLCSSSASLHLADMLCIEDRLRRILADSEADDSSSSSSIPHAGEDDPSRLRGRTSSSTLSPHIPAAADALPPPLPLHSQTEDGTSPDCLSTIHPQSPSYQEDVSDSPAIPTLLSPEDINLAPENYPYGKTPMIARRIRNTRIERKLSFVANNSKSHESAVSTNHMFGHLDVGGSVRFIQHASEQKHRLMPAVARWVTESVRRRGSRMLFKHHSQGHTLILTTKPYIEDWAEIFRSLPQISLLVYNENLAKRRRLGVHKISSYDVVIATFDGEFQTNHFAL